MSNLSTHLYDIKRLLDSVLDLASTALPVSVAGTAVIDLPVGSATEEKQDDLIVATDAIAAKLPVLDGDGRVPVTSYLSLSTYDKSLFGGTRAHADYVLFERLHDYPGASTAYDPDTYGFEKDVGNVGSIAHDANQGTLKLSVSSGAVGAKSRLRTHDIMRYQPGCMPIVQITGRASIAPTEVRVCRRSSATGIVTPHTLGTYAVTANKMNRYEIRYAYLGVQAAVFFLNGEELHFENFAGLLDEPFMKTANLPLSVEIVNVSADEQVVRVGLLDDSDGLYFEIVYDTPAALDFYYKCSSVRISGGGEYPFTTGVHTRQITGVSAIVPLFSIRVKSTLYAINSRVQVFPRRLSFFSETAAGACLLYLNPTTLTGATWAAVTPYPEVEIDEAANAVGGGTVVERIGLAANAYQSTDLNYLFNFLGNKLRRAAFTGTSDVLTVAALRESNTNVDPRATLVWQSLK